MLGQKMNLSPKKFSFHQMLNKIEPQNALEFWLSKVTLWETCTIGHIVISNHLLVIIWQQIIIESFGIWICSWKLHQRAKAKNNGQTPGRPKSKLFWSFKHDVCSQKKTGCWDPILDYRIYHVQSCPILSKPVQMSDVWCGGQVLCCGLHWTWKYIKDNYVHIQ